jgi:hypothetical protein
MSTSFDKPIFIIGAARSGTTMLGEILSRHPQVAYWLEPKYIWRFGQASAKHDIRTGENLDPKVKRYIRESFSRYLQKSGKTRFVEKTPSNVFRIEFIKEIFPEGRFVYILRDGRDVVLSAEKKWMSPPDSSALMRRLRKMEIPFSEFLLYIGSILRDVPGRILFPKRGLLWGPQFEGIRDYRRDHSVLETCAMQWLKSIEAAESGFENLSKDKVFTLRYEALIENPEHEIERLLDFCELSPIINMYDFTRKIKPGKKVYSETEVEKITQIYPIIGRKLEELGYYEK